MLPSEPNPTNTETAKAKPTVFLAYPFAKGYEWIQQCVPRLLKSYGCQVRSGEQYYKEISVAIGNDIARSNLLVAFLTRHQQLADKSWIASEWVLQEIGFAKGKGIPVLLVRELGVKTQIGIAGDVQFIPLDSDYEPFRACNDLRVAVRNLLFDGQDDGSLTLYHLAKASGKDAKGKQWYDYWLWLNGPEEALDQISGVEYQFPEPFKPEREPGEPGPMFDNWGETDTSFWVTAEIRFKKSKRKKLVQHEVTVAGSGLTLIGG